MTNQEVAHRLHELCQKGDYQTAHSELYAQNAISIENNTEGVTEKAEGMDAIRAKLIKFRSSVEEMHGGYCNEPKVFGKNIFMEMGMDVTMKGMGRVNMSEICHYIVQDGKIISEAFFF